MRSGAWVCVFYVVIDRTKLNVINHTTKRTKSTLCKQNERKTKKKHQNIWLYAEIAVHLS